MDIRSFKPEHAAKHILKRFGITGPRDLALLELIAWELGAMVRDTHLDGAEARLAVVGNRAIITVSTDINDPRRRRFSIAHELGHLELRRYRNGMTLCTREDIDNWHSHREGVDPEQEANEFAAALLMPEEFFAPLCRNNTPSFDLIDELAAIFDVSLTATAIRFLRFCPEPCAVVFSQDEIIKWFHGSKAFEDMGLFINVRDYVDLSSLAASLFKCHGIGASRKRVSASTWFAPAHYRGDATIQEESLAMPSYNAVLTLLWRGLDRLWSVTHRLRFGYEKT